MLLDGFGTRVWDDVEEKSLLDGFGTRVWDDVEGKNTSVVSMLKSLDWAKATAEKRATLITSLDCILLEIMDCESEELRRCVERVAKRV